MNDVLKPYLQPKDTWGSNRVTCFFRNRQIVSGPFSLLGPLKPKQLILTFRQVFTQVRLVMARGWSRKEHPRRLVQVPPTVPHRRPEHLRKGSARKTQLVCFLMFNSRTKCREKGSALCPHLERSLDAYRRVHTALDKKSTVFKKVSTPYTRASPPTRCAGSLRPQTP